MLHLFRYRLASCLTAYCLAALAIVGPSMAATVTINEDAVISMGNSFPDDHVRIVDGVSQPTHVELLAGGEVRGFTVTGNSVLEIDGGASTLLSGVQDNATLIMRGGSIDCTTFPTCLVIDYSALLTLTGNSSLHVFGGTISGAITLEDDSTAHFYGRNLSLFIDESGIFIEGQFAEGSYGYFSIGNSPFDNVSSRVFVHEIPEPSTATLMLIVAVYSVFLRSRLLENGAERLTEKSSCPVFTSCS